MTPLADAFDRVRPWIEEALGERPLWHPDDWRDMVLRGEATLWSGARSGIFTRVKAFDRSGEVLVDVGPGGGDLEEMAAAAPYIEQRMRAAGVTQAHIYATRPGWERVFKSQGYERYATVLRKFL